MESLWLCLEECGVNKMCALGHRVWIKRTWLW